MSYALTFEEHPRFLRATVTGSNDPGVVARYLDDVLRECRRRDCHRLLLVERLEGPRLDVDEVFTIASEGAANALGVFDAIAYVDERMGDMAYFAETVAINRGMPVKTFDNVDDAETWLDGFADESPDGQSIFRNS